MVDQVVKKEECVSTRVMYVQRRGRKTEMDVDGHHQRRLEKERTVGWKDGRPSCVYAARQQHRPYTTRQSEMTDPSSL